MRGIETRPERSSGGWLTFGCGLLVLAVSAVNHARGFERNPVHVDEPVWTVRAYFFKLAFLDRNLTHEFWTGYDGIDQPHVNDFLIGASLTLAGEAIPDGPVGLTPQLTHPRLAGRRLRVARLPAAVLGAVVPVVVFATAVVVTRRRSAGLVAGSLYACHPLTLACHPRAMSDAPLMLFSTVPVLLLALAFSRDERRGSETAFSPLGRVSLVLGPLCLGSAVGTKLVGIFIAFGVMATLAAACAQRGVARDRRVRGSGKFLGAFVALTLVGTVTVNPTLYSGPLTQFVEALGHRWQVAQRQRGEFPNESLGSVPARARAAYQNLFAVAGRPAGLTLLGSAGLGFIALAGREFGRVRRRLGPSAGLPVVVGGAVLACVYLPTVPLNWDRYFLPFLPFIAVSAGAGVVVAVSAGAGVVVAVEAIRRDAVAPDVGGSRRP